MAVQARSDKAFFNLLIAVWSAVIRHAQ